MATSYTNYLGSGRRLGALQLSTTFATTGSGANGRLLPQLVDGYTVGGNFYLDSQTVAGKVIEFQILGSPRVVDAFKIYKATSSGVQSFKFQGYDGATWTDLTTFNWPTASGATEFTFTNTTAYRRYRFLGVSGTITTASIYEVEFKSEAASAYETGDRSSLITVTSSGITSASGMSVQALVDGSEATNSTNSWKPSTSTQAVNSSSIIKFALSAAQTFVAVTLRGTSGYADNGTWKVQGSSDDSAWSDISDPFLWDADTGGSSSRPFVGFVGITNPASYSYYRLIGVSGVTSNVPYYTEILFDAGPAPTWESALQVTSDHADVLATANSQLEIAHDRADVLSRGPGSEFRVASYAVHVLTSIGPAGELSGISSAGLSSGVEFGGDEPIEPVVLASAYADEGVYDAEINVSVGNPFKSKFTSSDEYRAVMTRSLRSHYVDESTMAAEIGSLPPPPLQFFMSVTGR